MDLITLISQSMGAAWASGINLYATCSVLGLLGRFDIVELQGKLSIVESWWVIGPALALYCVEFVVDKVPLADSAWDVIHTFVRVPAGAMLAASSFSVEGTAPQIAALVSGGAIAAESHALKSGTRAAINVSPEPLSNWIASLGEDVIVVSALIFAAKYPGWFLLGLAVLLLISAVVLYFMWGFVRALIVRIATMFGRSVAQQPQGP